MKKIYILLSCLLMVSCTGQGKIDPREKFESELNDNSKDEFYKNAPLPFSESGYARSSYYASFKILENSGTDVLFYLDKTKQEVLNYKFKTYARLENSNLKSLEYNFRYLYENKLLLLPDISEGWNDLVLDNNLKNNEIEIYLIQKGKLKNAFKEESSNETNYNYSCGVYFFRKINILIYWFYIYK